MKITKAILPVAGKGTRVMPLTFHQPKCLVAVADRPMIHYVIDELIAAGIKEIIIVFGPAQEVIKNYLDFLKKDGWWREVKFYFAKQAGPYGNADALLVAKTYILDEAPVVVAFCDDLLAGQNPLADMLAFYEKKQRPILLFEEVPRNLISLYGVAATGLETEGDFYSVVNLVEKPRLEEAPSNLSLVGRYVLPPEIFNYIEKLYPYQGRELYLTDALKLYLKDKSPIWGLKYNGARFDCGSKKGLIKAQAHFSTNHPEFKN